MAGYENRCKCTYVRNTIYFQRFIGLFGVLVNLFDYGSAIFWRKIFQMRGRGRRIT